jgi:hypothetical protein
MGMGNAGQELQVVRIMRDLEQRIEDSWDFLWGETGDTVGSMRWEEVTLWLAAMGAPHEAIQVQQREQHNGQDIEDYLVSSNNDSEGIQKVLLPV